MKVKAYVGMGLVGCHRERVVEIPDEDVEGLEGLKRDEVIDEYVKEWLWSILDYGWDALEDKAR